MGMNSPEEPRRGVKRDLHYQIHVTTFPTTMPTTNRRRPRVAFLTSHAPYPPPLIGAQIRVHQLIRALSADVDIVLVVLESNDKAPSDIEWDLRPQMTRILSVPRPDRSIVADPLWGPW